MLERLHITNYALISDLEIELHEGLNIITGETGAGKSIMLDALSLLFGARADGRSAKRNDRKSVIESVFSVKGNAELKTLLTSNDVDCDDEECILRREILPNGRTRSFINDCPVALSLLREVSMSLVDIHSQHQNQLLTGEAFQLNVLDAIADNSTIREEYAIKFNKLKSSIKRLKQLKAEVKHNAENAEFMRFQLEKIEAVNPQPGETTALEESCDKLAENVAAKEELAEALAIIENGEGSISEKLGRLSEIIENHGARFSDDLSLAERIESIAAELSDIASTIENTANDIDADPADLEYAEQRLKQLRELQSRFGADNEEELQRLKESLTSNLDLLENAPAAIKEAENKARADMASCKATAAELTETRIAAARQLQAELVERAKPLGMKNLQCEIEITQSDLAMTGSDNVRFMFAFNKNQVLTPVGESASGGEISRLMLCIKAITANKMELPTIVFDEIDTGVSGEIASKMGALMHDISMATQTIVITHLPQVAARGDYHYKVFKEDDDNSTHTFIRELDGEERVTEIASMLGDSTQSEASRLNAMSLLEKK